MRGEESVLKARKAREEFGANCPKKFAGAAAIEILRAALSDEGIFLQTRSFTWRTFPLAHRVPGTLGTRHSPPRGEESQINEQRVLADDNRRLVILSRALRIMLLLRSMWLSLCQERRPRRRKHL